MYGIKLTAKVKLKKKRIVLSCGEKTNIGIKNKNIADKVGVWKVSNAKIVKVNKKTGRITAKRKGSTIVTLVMKSGCRARCKVVVL